MPHPKDIVTFHEPAVPEGPSPCVLGAGPSLNYDIVDWSDAWPGQFQLLAKPIIDIDLIVADPNNEESYLPALERAGFELRVREPWWFGHRVLRHLEPPCHLYVFG